MINLYPLAGAYPHRTGGPDPEGGGGTRDGMAVEWANRRFACEVYLTFFPLMLLPYEHANLTEEKGLEACEAGG